MWQMWHLHTHAKTVELLRPNTHVLHHRIPRCSSGLWCAEVEDQLAVVIAQEEEVRAIADEHLEREGHLTKLLEDLYRQQKAGWVATP